MERAKQLSFSVTSLAEGSEIISEAEEIKEINALREKGDNALKIEDFKEALRNYEEALEIDSKNTDIYGARSHAYCWMGNYSDALKDAQTFIGLDPDNVGGYYLQGLAQKHLKQSKEAIDSFLTAIDTDMDIADKATDEIVEVTVHECQLSKEMTESLKAMDAYKKMCEIGVCLFQAQKYDMCINVLELAQKIQTNQKGIQMRVLLTLANAYSSTKLTDPAISSYEECLNIAMATHDQLYQTKALVNIATLHLENGDTHQAIAFYEKLLHLEAELLEESGSYDILPDFWTKELQCGIHLNLSIAYKSIGNMSDALLHANRYLECLERYDMQGKLKAESYHNCGMLREILGQYEDALQNYKLYLKTSKENKDKKGMAQAYGCLGTVYASLQNWKLSITYHEQYITLAKKSQDKKMMVLSNEMLGDTYMLKGDCEKAIASYNTMVDSCIPTDYRAKAAAMCKLGTAYKIMTKYQHSKFFFDQAYELSKQCNFIDIQTLCQYNIAYLNQYSSQLVDLEVSQKYFKQLIPHLEKMLQQHRDENTYCPLEYHTQLLDCYDGLQNVTSKIGSKEDCLQYAEAYRRRTITQLQNFSTQHGFGMLTASLWDTWTIDKIKRVVDQQNGVVLYYSLLDASLLLWVLKPGEGLVRFYSGKKQEETSMRDQIKEKIGNLRSNIDWNSMQTGTGNRALPFKNSELEIVRQKNLTLGSPSECDDGEKISSISYIEKESHLSDDCLPEITTHNLKTGKQPKSINRQLYDILLSPVEDILSSLEPKSHLVIIPDKELFHCPFNILQDWSNKFLMERFRITYLPNLYLLEKVFTNEMNYLRSQDELQFERSQSRRGGTSKYITKQIYGSCSPTSNPRNIMSEESLNPRQISNPRLLMSSSPERLCQRSHTSLMSRENTDLRCGSPLFRTISPASNIPEVSPSVSLRSLGKVGSPVPVEKLLATQTYSTLTTKTATGTDIVSSSQIYTPFQQISNKEKCIIFANPKLPERLMLHGKEWKPNDDLLSANHEAFCVASYLDTVPFIGAEATKDNFLAEAPKATVLHIATYGCLKEGLLAFGPNPSCIEQPPPENSYLISCEDMLCMSLSAQLVVLNCGFSSCRKGCTEVGYKLAGAFITAGAQCVVMCLWQVSDEVMEKFLFNFYSALQESCLVTEATKSAIEKLKEDNRFCDISSWSPFVVIGKDTLVDLKHIRHAMLHQTIDKTEQMVEESSGKEYLNPKSVLSDVPSREDNLSSIQTAVKELLINFKKKSQVVHELIDLLDGALKRLHTEENIRKTSVLSENIVNSEGGISLLKLLGFHFQAKGSALKNPYIIYPYFNIDDLLIPAYDALRSIVEISKNTKCSQAVCDTLPLPQDTVSLLVDLLSLTKHASEIQLKVTDLSVKPLWNNTKLKTLLTSTGFHQIGLLLNFNKIPANRQLLTGLLQFLLAVSLHKSQVLLYRLDVNLLGKPNAKSVASSSTDLGKLPSLHPVVLPRNQLKMSTPWLSALEPVHEMQEKIKLARSKSLLEEDYRSQADKAKSWHQISLLNQAEEALSTFGRPKTVPSRVKVQPGSTGSTERVPLNREVKLNIPETAQRRDYAHYVLKQRIENIDLRHKNDMMKLYLPYVQST